MDGVSAEPALAPPRRETVALAGGDFSILTWDQAGEQAPHLHFAHANGFNGLTYRRLLAPLAERMRISAWDARGHGMTTAPADPDRLRSWTLYADDLGSWLDRQPAPVLLAGHSMGATTSIRAAARWPDKVRGLVLFDPVLPGPVAAWRFQILNWLGRTRDNPLAQGARKRRARFDSRAAMLASYTGRGAFRTWPTGFVEDYVEGGSRIEEDGACTLTCQPAWEAANFATGGGGTWRFVGSLTCPVRILRADIASTFPDPAPEAFRRRRPDALIETVPGTTHFLPMERADLARAALLAALGLPATVSPC